MPLAKLQYSILYSEVNTSNFFRTPCSGSGAGITADTDWRRLDIKLAGDFSSFALRNRSIAVPLADDYCDGSQ